jgi:hypothetical protein
MRTKRQPPRALIAGDNRRLTRAKNVLYWRASVQKQRRLQDNPRCFSLRVIGIWAMPFHLGIAAKHLFPSTQVFPLNGQTDHEIHTWTSHNLNNER